MPRLHHLLGLTLVLAHAAFAPAAAAADISRIISSIVNENTRAMAITPVFNQRIIHGLPDGWRPGAEKSERDSYSMEFLPEKQTSPTRSEMILLKGFRGIAQDPRATPKALLAQVAAELRAACGADKAITLSLGDTKVDGLDAHGAVMGCTGPPDSALADGGKGLGEIAFYLALHSGDDLFVLQHSIRTEAFAKADAPINPSNAFMFFRGLQPVKICERDLPELACIQRQPR